MTDNNTNNTNNTNNNAPKKRIKPEEVFKSNGYSYEEWMRLLDLYVQKKIGISVHECVDFCSYDAWNGDTDIVTALHEDLAEMDELVAGALEELYGG